MKPKNQIIIVLLSILPFFGAAQTWSGFCSTCNNSEPIGLSSLDKLYFGLGTGVIGGLNVKGICSFDGQTVDSLGEGLGFSGMYDSDWYNGKLIVGGAFAYAGISQWNNPNTQCIAAWDSLTGWQSITPNGGSNNFINCVEVYNNELYVGGQFTGINNVSVSRVARWDGSQWTNMATGVHGGNTVVNCMAVYRNELYVGGNFTTVGSNNLASYYIAKWNGSNWDSVPTGPNWYITDMVVDSLNDLLYVCGGFTNVSGNTCYGVAVWNDSIWQPVGSGLDTLWGTQCLAMFNGELYAGGGNVTVTTQGDSIKNIYKYDGTKWVSVDGGANNTVLHMAVFQGNLYIAGAFSLVGNGIYAIKIACYGTTCPTSVSVYETLPEIPFTMFPNPNNDILRIESNEPSVLLFRLIDSNGKRVSEKLFFEKMEFDTKSLPKGTYVVQVSLGDGSRLHAEKLIISN